MPKGIICKEIGEIAYAKRHILHIFLIQFSA
jgi:hypothetical protein